MSRFDSGDLVEFKNTAGIYQPGIVLRASSNDKQDGSKDEFIELAPVNVVLVYESECRLFGDTEEADPNAVVGSTSGDVGGLKNKRSRTETGPRNDIPDSAIDELPEDSEEPTE